MNLLVIRIVAFYSQERLLEKLRQEEALSQAVLLKGDVICSTNTGKQLSTTTVIADMTNSQQQQQLLFNSSQISVCSCTCMETFSEWRQTRRKRAKWKKQQRGGLNKSMKTAESTSSVDMMYAMRRSSI
jgi:hypothetical protein